MRICYMKLLHSVAPSWVHQGDWSRQPPRHPICTRSFKYTSQKPNQYTALPAVDQMRCSARIGYLSRHPLFLTPLQISVCRTGSTRPQVHCLHLQPRDGQSCIKMRCLHLLVPLKPFSRLRAGDGSEVQRPLRPAGAAWLQGVSAAAPRAGGAATAGPRARPQPAAHDRCGAADDG